MPTGYTAGVMDGTVTSFQEYALMCARNFGACIMLRDEPLSSEIPEFQPSDHYQKAGDEAYAELKRLTEMTQEELHKEFCEQKKKRINEAKDGIKRKQKIFTRYNAMLEKAKLFKSPTPEHDNFAKFIVSQLEESIRFDCGGNYWHVQLEHAKQQPFEDWWRSRIDELNKEIERCRKNHKEEVERTKQRNEWVSQLRRAIKEAGR